MLDLSAPAKKGGAPGNCFVAVLNAEEKEEDQQSSNEPALTILRSPEEMAPRVG
jgi:hypothetical protein